MPRESKEATFEPILKQYMGLAKILITLAAASISFGGLDSNKITLGVGIAKILLALSIAFGLFFCLLCIKFYEDYLQDLKSYTAIRAAFVESCGLSSVIFFFVGYVVWACQLVQ